MPASSSTPRDTRGRASSDVQGASIIRTGHGTYRADGQRIEKVEGITFSWSGSRESGQYDTNYAQNRPTSRYYYDGQMGFEDDYNPSGTVTQVNRYILGARGIDRIARTESGNTTLAYPMYDGHGNMRALLTRDGTGYDTGNWKTYDVWGSVRSGGSSADPKQGYVASIGHVSDSESSLIYMRARYYEPATGRFLSEDRARDGLNWYRYCVNNPINAVDETGEMPAVLISLLVVLVEGVIAACMDLGLQLLLNGGNWNSVDWARVAISGAIGILGGAVGHFFRTLHYTAKGLQHARYRHWTEGGGTFSVYFLKFIGAGAGTSAGSYHFTAIVRAMWLGGAGSLFMQFYGGWLMMHIGETFQ